MEDVGDGYSLIYFGRSNGLGSYAEKYCKENKIPFVCADEKA